MHIKYLTRVHVKVYDVKTPGYVSLSINKGKSIIHQYVDNDTDLSIDLDNRRLYGNGNEWDVQVWYNEGALGEGCLYKGVMTFPKLPADTDVQLVLF